MSDFDQADTATSGGYDRRPSIELAYSPEIRATIDEVTRYLSRPGDHRKVFQFAGSAVVVSPSTSNRLTDTGVNKIRRSIPRQANRSLLAGPIEQVCTFHRTNEEGDMIPKQVPNWITTGIAELGGEGLLPLSGIADFPVISQENQLLCGRSGYDIRSGLYVDCEPVPMDGNKFENPKDAYKWLRDEWLGEFPFADEKDAARSLAIPLTILSRRTRIMGGAPIPFITAPDANTGKTLLARVLVEVVTGSPLPVSAWDHDNEAERRKGLLSIALENPAAVLFDNINNGWQIRDGALDKYITSDDYRDRVLGKNETATAPSTCLPMFTGNNISPGSIDLASRSYEIRLEKKGKGAFKRPDLVAWTQKNRIKIIHALFTIATWRRAKTWEPVSRFPAWGEFVGGKLQFASGMKDLFQSWDINPNNTWDEDLEELLIRMNAPAYKKQNSMGFTPSDMSEHFSEYIGALDDHAQAKWMLDHSGALKTNAKIPPKAITGLLNKRNGHPAGKYRLRCVKGPHPTRSDGRIVNLFKAVPMDDVPQDNPEGEGENNP